MVAVDGEDRNGNVDIRILVVDMIECAAAPVSALDLSSRCKAGTEYRPLEVLRSIAQHLQLTWLFSVAVHT